MQNDIKTFKKLYQLTENIIFVNIESYILSNRNYLCLKVYIHTKHSTIQNISANMNLYKYHEKYPPSDMSKQSRRLKVAKVGVSKWQKCELPLFIILSTIKT